MRTYLRKRGERGAAVIEYAVALGILLTWAMYTWKLLLWVYVWNLYMVRTSVQSWQP